MEIVIAKNENKYSQGVMKMQVIKTQTSLEEEMESDEEISSQIIGGQDLGL